MRHLVINFMTRFKDKILKNLVCRVALATKVENFNKHIDTIKRINVEAQRCLKAIPLEKWAFSYDICQRNGIMITNMSKVFNNVLKGARSLPVTTLVQLIFFRLNIYFVPRREQGANRLTLDEQYTPYVDTKIKANVVKAGSFEIVFYNHIQGRFHVNAKSGKAHRLNLHKRKCTCGKTLINGFPCSHILSTC